MAVRTLIVGVGRRGREWAREVRGAPGFELSGCVDPDPAAAEYARSALALSRDHIFDTAERACDTTPADLAIIATPAEGHAAACHAALDRGLAVLVEKPFTLRLADAAAVVAHADRAGRPLGVAQNYRYMRAFRTARRLMAGGAVGRVGAVHAHYYRVPHAMAPTLARLPHSVLYGVAVHHLDVMRYIVDAPLSGAFATSFEAPWGSPPAGASINVQLAFANGTHATYTASYESSGHEYFEGGQEFYARVIGETATLHVFHRWLVLCERGRLPRPIRRGRRAVSEERVLLDDMARAIATGDAPDSSGRDNLQTMAVVEACVRAAERRVWVDPQELLRDTVEHLDAGHRS